MADLAYLNEGKPWSEMDLADLRNHVATGADLAETSCFLIRPESEVAAKASELGLTWPVRKH